MSSLCLGRRLRRFPLPSIWSDAQGRITFYNEAAAGFRGTRPELRAKQILRVLQALPAGRHAAAARGVPAGDGAANKTTDPRRGSGQRASGRHARFLHLPCDPNVRHSRQVDRCRQRACRDQRTPAGREGPNRARGPAGCVCRTRPDGDRRCSIGRCATVPSPGDLLSTTAFPPVHSSSAARTSSFFPTPRSAGATFMHACWPARSCRMKRSHSCTRTVAPTGCAGPWRLGAKSTARLAVRFCLPKSGRSKLRRVGR